MVPATRAHPASGRRVVAPDGGWGWVVVVANAMSNIVTMSIVTTFGLIFKDKLASLQMPAANMTTIISVFSIVSMSMGCITGPTLKAFGYRKVAYGAGTLFVLGVLGTTFADTFAHFILTYSIMAAAGNGLLTSSHYLALNTYFREKRSKAAGLAMTLTGLGPIFYPPVITFLLSWYGVTGCMLLLTGVSSHVFVAASLLQPVKHHYPEGLLPVEDVPKAVEKKSKGSSGDSSDDLDDYLDQRPTEITKIMDPELRLSRNSLGTKNVTFKLPAKVIEDDVLSNDFNNIDKSRKPSACRSLLISWLDLDLLADRVFNNIILGMAIAAFAEINFSVLTPIILSEMKYTNVQIASVMSTLATTDIMSRFGSPFIGDWLQWTPRVMYMVALSLLIVTRMSLLVVSSYRQLLCLAVAMGLAKGLRTVYMILVIPNHVPIEKLASASGMRMVSNAMVLLFLGPLVGFIRDFSGNYELCIVFMNVITAVCLTLWTCEMLYFRCKRRWKSAANGQPQPPEEGA